jgi:hypothetical protein
MRCADSLIGKTSSQQYMNVRVPAMVYFRVLAILAARAKNRLVNVEVPKTAYRPAEGSV